MACDPPPSHNIIAKFRREVIGLDSFLAGINKYLLQENEITFNEVFIDGTKIEANANKYSWVWKKAVNKFEAKLDENIKTLLEKALIDHCILANSLDELITTLEEKLSSVELKGGKGVRKTPMQRIYEKAIEFSARKAKYASYNATFDGRNSFSKIDNDATFMRMKDDHMQNGQLKPAYNIQIAVNSEYIVGTYTSADRNDVNTLIPFLNKMEAHYDDIFKNIVADSGYESEENYAHMKNNGYTPYVKPQNYEISKTNKFKTNIAKRENMQYNEKEDYYTCANGKKLRFTHESKKIFASGYEQILSHYECEDCSNCPIKNKCTTAVSNRTLKFAKLFGQYRIAS